MSKDEVIRTLQMHERELREAGVDALFLFGSVARGDGRARSDIDIAFDLGHAPHFSLLSQADLQCRLQDWLAAQVDFVCRSDLRAEVRDRIEQDLVQVF